MQPALSPNEKRQEDEGRRDNQGLISGEMAGRLLLGQGHRGLIRNLLERVAHSGSSSRSAMARRLTF
jgi:hypothetical protein